MPDIRVELDNANHNALKMMALDSGLTLKRLVQVLLIGAINKSKRKPTRKEKP